MSPRRTADLLVLVATVLLLLAAVPRSAAASAGWQWPLPPPDEVVHDFDPPAADWLPGHRGVDLAGRVGERVLAAGAGVVTYAGRIAGVGVVAISHGALRTTYQPVRPSVHRGQAVAAGQLIGHLVLAGSHCLPQACLHWGLLRGSAYLDPLSLLGLAEVRLLPLGASSPGLPVSAPITGAAATALLGTVVSARRRRSAPTG